MKANDADIIWERLEDFYLEPGTSLQEYDRLKHEVDFDDNADGPYGDNDPRMRNHCVYRARVPGGWLVKVAYGSNAILAYVPWSPDPAFKKHSKWKV